MRPSPSAARSGRRDLAPEGQRLSHSTSPVPTAPRASRRASGLRTKLIAAGYSAVKTSSPSSRRLRRATLYESQSIHDSIYNGAVSRHCELGPTFNADIGSSTAIPAPDRSRHRQWQTDFYKFNISTAMLQAGRSMPSSTSTTASSISTTTRGEQAPPVPADGTLIAAGPGYPVPAWRHGELDLAG